MAELVPVLALDLATSTGWALRGRDGVVTSGVQAFDLRRGESPGMRFLRFRRWLGETLELGRFGSHAPEWIGGGIGMHGGVIAYERPLSMGKGFRAGIAKELEALLLVEAAAAGVETTNIAPSSLKKHTTGKGNADKAAMVLAATRRWGKPVESEDEADALCVLAWCLSEIEVRRG